MHLGCFFFCIRVSQLLTLGWRSSCLRRPVFSFIVSLCGLFVTLQTIFLISDCWLQYTTKKGSFMRAETFYNTFSQWLIWVPLHFWVSPLEDFSLALAINYSGHELSALHCWLAEWQRMGPELLNSHSWVSVFLSQFTKSGLALKVSLGFW